jgi:hypothetical protein
MVAEGKLLVEELNRCVNHATIRDTLIAVCMRRLDIESAQIGDTSHETNVYRFRRFCDSGER